ncbi:MAG: GldG family protein [Treponema sp.]|jgi:hypothetical protein|nr:GldG family protein [Treponema sp.]
MMKGILKSRLFRYGSLATLITVLAIFFVVILNVALTLLFKKFPLRLDLTREQMFQLSQDTEDFLARLDTDIEVTILNTEEGFTSSGPVEYFVQAHEMITRYAQHSPHVRISYVDLIRNPDFASRYPDLSPKVNDILVTAGGKSRLVASADLFNIQTSYYGSQVISSKAEQTMTSVMLTLTSGEKTFVSMITNHGEEAIGAFTDLFTMNGYEFSNLNLLTQEIPPEVSLVILAAPLRDVEETELQKLEAFLSGGDNRTLFYLTSAAQPALPLLESFLAEWGIGVEEGAAFETDTSRLLNSMAYISFAEYAEDAYSKSAAEKGLLPVIAQAKPLKVLFEQSRYRTVTLLLRLSPDSGVRPAGTDADWQPSRADITGNVPVMLLSSSVRNGLSGALEQTNVLVSGSILSLNQSLLGSPNFANSGYLLDLLGSLAGRERSLWIQSKAIRYAQLGVTLGQIIIIALVFMALLPLGTLVSGIVVWLRRRHR